MDDQITIQSADATEFSLSIAGAGSRSYAFLLDWHIRIVVAAAWILIVYLTLKFTNGTELDLFTNSAWSSVTWIPAALIYFLYHPVLEILMHGRTPGKRMAGVRIVDINGRTPGAAALALRNVFRLVDSLPSLYMVGLTACLFSKNALRIGDMAAGTMLIKEKITTKADLEQVSMLAINTHYEPEHLELLNSLLSRWKDMDSAKRLDLAEKMLNKMGVELPPTTGAHIYGKSVYAKLLAVQQGEKI